MSTQPSIRELVMPHVRRHLEERSDATETAAMLHTIEGALASIVGDSARGGGREYLERVLGALDVPLPRVLTAGWRRHAAFVRFAGPPATSGSVELVEYETDARWRMTPSIEGFGVVGPTVEVGVTFRVEGARVEISDGRFTALTAASFGYVGHVCAEEAPEQCVPIGPVVYRLPGGQIGFGDGWPIEPWTEQGPWMTATRATATSAARLAARAPVR